MVKEYYDDYIVTTGSYINIYSQLGGFDIYVLPYEPNKPPTPDDVEMITQTVLDCKTLSEMYRALNALELDCLSCGYTIIDQM